MRLLLVGLIVLTLVLSCASGTKILTQVDALSTTGTIKNDEKNDYVSVLAAYTAEFAIPNPLFGEAESSTRRFDPNHQNLIVCKATLLDDVSTAADIKVSIVRAGIDSMEVAAYEKEYREKNVREGMFRIRVTMESGFSRKSMETEHWAMYIENAAGTMIEPSDIVMSEVTAANDSAYSRDFRMSFRKNVFKRDITLYFKRMTFFGEDLFGEKNPYIVFAMSRDRKVLTRVAFTNALDEKSFSVKRKFKLE